MEVAPVNVGVTCVTCHVARKTGHVICVLNVDLVVTEIGLQPEFSDEMLEGVAVDTRRHTNEGVIVKSSGKGALKARDDLNSYMLAAMGALEDFSAQ